MAGFHTYPLATWPTPGGLGPALIRAWAGGGGGQGFMVQPVSLWASKSPSRWWDLAKGSLLESHTSVNPLLSIMLTHVCFRGQ